MAIIVFFYSAGAHIYDKMRAGCAQAQAPAHHLVSAIVTEEALKAPAL